MFFSKRVIKRVALYLTALIIALVLLSPYFIEPLINSKPLKSKLSAEIRKMTGVLVEPEGIEFMLFPNPGICFLNFQHEFNERIRLTIDRIEVDLDLINLFNRRVSVEKIQVEGPRLIYSPPGSTVPRLPALADRTPFQFKIPEDAVTELFALFPD
ncbi:MAG: AsmA family protein, partial [Desulfobacterales bacterium]|nr:AsmA family protein [Desulfobacterales bacterium]